MTAIYIDADACPVREEVFRVAGRLGVDVVVVSDGSRPIRPPGLPFVRMVTVGEGADIVDDWIAERIAAGDICVTSDIPPAASPAVPARSPPTARSGRQTTSAARSPAAPSPATCANSGSSPAARSRSPNPTARRS